MALVEKLIHRKSEEYGEVKDLYWSTFKGHDGFPMWLMSLDSRRDRIRISGYYDGGRLCGMSVVLTDPDTFYILYLAVCPDLRSKGYGSQILTMLKGTAGNRNAVLDIEDPFEECDDPEIRSRRMAFYLRNGFRDTGYKYFDKDGKYLIMSVSGSPSKESLYAMLRWLSFGFYRADIRRDVSM